MHIRCPICRKELEAPDDFPSRPFCSPRCKQIDLANWLDEKYRLPRPIVPEDLEEHAEGARALAEGLLAERGLSEESLLEQALHAALEARRSRN